MRRYVTTTLRPHFHRKRIHILVHDAQDGCIPKQPAGWIQIKSYGNYVILSHDLQTRNISII